MQYIIRYGILTISALAAYLVISLIEALILDQTRTTSPYVATAIGMAIVVLVFVPLFSWMDRFTKKIVQTLVGKTGAKIGRNGMVIVILLVLILLYFVFLFHWFNVRIV